MRPDELPWVVGVLLSALEQTPATGHAIYVAHANDLLERLGSGWRISQVGAPVRLAA